MVTDKQERRLMKLVQTEKTKVLAAAKAGIDPKTARKYLRSGRLPSQVKKKLVNLEAKPIMKPEQEELHTSTGKTNTQKYTEKKAIE